MDCGGSSIDPTSQAIRDYRSLVKDFGDLQIQIGSRDDMKIDSVFGSDSGLASLACGRDEGDCESSFLDAIETFQSAKSNAQDIATGLVQEEATNCREKAEAYVPAIEKFIESAKRHVDTDRSSFSRGSDFTEGMEHYQKARGLDVMDPELFEQKVEVYNSES